MKSLGMKTLLIPPATSWLRVFGYVQQVRHGRKAPVGFWLWFWRIHHDHARALPKCQIYGVELEPAFGLGAFARGALSV